MVLSATSYHFSLCYFYQLLLLDFTVCYQHLSVTIFSDLAQSIIIAGAVCTAGHQDVTAQIFSTVLFVAGLATVAQSTIGCRQV